MTDTDRFVDQVPAAGTPSPDGPRPDRRSLGARLHFLITPRWIALIIGAIAFALACYLILAPWQFGRNAERSAQNAAVAAAIKAPPAPIGDLMSTTAQPRQSAIWHRVSVSGTFDTSREAYIRLRQDAGGNPANEVVVPLVMADGARVLVDRGYVSFTSVQQGAALPALPGGTVTVTGRVQADQTDPKHRPPVAAPDGRMQYTAASSALAGPGTVYRGYLQLTSTSPGVISAIGMPQRDSGPFFSYALQWLAFGAIAVLGIGYFIYREITDPTEEDIYLPSPSGGDGASGNGAHGDEASGDGASGDGASGDRASAGEARADGARRDGPAGDGPPSDDASGGGTADGAAVPARPDDAGRRQTAGSRPARGRRRPRRGFDKSQLYDPE